MFDIKVSSQHKKEKKKFVFDKINSLYGKYDYQKEFSFNIHDLKNIKMDFSLESIYNPVPFIGTYIERVINDNDVENEFEESEKTRHNLSAIVVVSISFAFPTCFRYSIRLDSCCNQLYAMLGIWCLQWV
jgi:hypothetical protein